MLSFWTCTGDMIRFMTDVTFPFGPLKRHDLGRIKWVGSDSRLDLGKFDSRISQFVNDEGCAILDTKRVRDIVNFIGTRRTIDEVGTSIGKEQLDLIRKEFDDHLPSLKNK